MKNPFKRTTSRESRMGEPDYLPPEWERRMEELEAMSPEEREAASKESRERFKARVAHDKEKRAAAQKRDSDAKEARLSGFYEEMEDLEKDVAITVKVDGEWIVLEGRDIAWHKIKLMEKLSDIQLIKKAVAIIKDPSKEKDFLDEEARLKDNIRAFFGEFSNGIGRKARRILNEIRSDDKKVAEWLDDDAIDEIVGAVDKKIGPLVEKLLEVE